jgi:hypothetical protein
MASQTVRNGQTVFGSSPDAQDRPPNGVLDGVSSFCNDLTTLATLQIRLASCDLRDSAQVAIPIAVGLVVCGFIIMGCVVLALAGFALWLASLWQLPIGPCMMGVALGGLIIAGIVGALLARSFSKSFSYFRRSREEFERNLAWIKTALTHSGR